MSKRVLLPIDEVGHAQLACDLAVELFPESTLVLLHVIDPAEASFSAETVPTLPESWYEQEKERAQRHFDEVAEMVADADVDIERVIEVGKPAQTIVETVDEEDIDHVVMGSHGRSGVSRLLLGSVAETVVRRSPAPVTVARALEDE